MEDYNTINTDWFAAGENTVDGVGCPMVTAGISPDGSHAHNTVAGRYDRIVGRMLGCDDRIATVTVNEDTAREAWFEVIEHRDGKEEDIARNVARELGWLDTDEAQ